MNMRFYGTLIVCAALFASGIVGLWCLKHGLINVNTRAGSDLAIFSAMAPFWAVLIAIVAFFRRKEIDAEDS
jgi:hypothetical protein